MTLKEQLIAHFSRTKSSPFLFVGSGFSRRYLGLEDWKGLLQKFSNGLKDFEYYMASADGYLPRVAELLAKDFNDHWWKSVEYKESRNKNKSKIKDNTSALRFEICGYLDELSTKSFADTNYQDEISLLSSLNVDGIITTNWDSFLERLFPDYKIFIGQSELLFSNPQSIAEIYKIHGSITKPSSLVLTSKDYELFNEKNPYLAAKLITLFVEHPIVFIGYSLSDDNIISLIKAITSCLGQEKLDKLRDHLIFVQRKSSGSDSEYSNTLLAVDGAQVPITVIKTNSFFPVYEAIDSIKRQIPARVLRYCKEQLYELVISKEPEQKICVVDIDDIESKEDVEFVVGIGVASTYVSHKGYSSFNIKDIFVDVLNGSEKLDSTQLLKYTIPNINSSCKYVPIFKYLKEIGINSQEQYENSEWNFDKYVNIGFEGLKTKNYIRQYVKTERNKSTIEIIETNTSEKVAILLPFQKAEEINIEALEKFLQENSEKFDTANSNYASYFRKLACLYDRLKYGW